jgi:flagellar protein FlaE
MGMMDWVEDDEDGSSTESTDEDASDDMDDFDDFEDDFDDFDSFDDDFEEESSGDVADGDDFDDFDAGFDDGGGGGGGGGGSAASNEQLADFEDRIGELETQVGSISSTMNTVREENKQIGETVDELDDTIRKLLDIYEMVTRGINPFVDDAKEMGGLEHGDGAFGLFDSEEEEEDDLSSEVANADAEDFFDEDFGDLDPDQGEERAEAAAGENLADEETDGPEMLEPEPDPEPGTSDTDESGGGVSFDELKAEYEDDGWEDDTGDAETDEPEEAAPDVDADEADAEHADAEGVDSEEMDDGPDVDGDAPSEVHEEGLDSEEETDTETDSETDEPVDGTDGDAESDGEDEDEGDAEDEVDADPEQVADAETEVDSAERVDQSETTAPDPPESGGTGPVVGAAEAKTDEQMFESDAPAGRPTTTSEPAPATAQHEPVGREQHGVPRADDSRAHLAHLPSTYVAESVAMEWMRFLVSTGGLLGASRALRQYEDFGWISAEVRAALDTYARLVSTPDDNSSQGSLSVEHHETSLSYVSRLGDRTPDAGAMSALAADGGTNDGIRR